MNKFRIALLIICANISISSLAIIRYVKPVASGSGDGLSWVNASGDLSSTLNASASGDQIWVAAGSYKPSQYPTDCIGCDSERDYAFHLKNETKLYGGFFGNETAINQRIAGSNVSILSGDIGNQDDSDDNTYHVLVSAFDNANTWIDGFKIEKGGTKVWFANSAHTFEGADIQKINGGGAFITNSAIQITNCQFTGNFGYSGSGLVLVTFNGTVSNCNFSGNVSQGSGAGIAGFTFFGIIENCTFNNNTSNINGGAITQYGGNTGVIRNCAMFNNTAYRGGAIHSSASENKVINCTIGKNTSTEYGTVYNENYASPRIINTIIWDNAVGSGSAGIYNLDGTCVPIISNSIIEGGYSPCTNCPNSNGNIDPLYINSLNTKGNDNLPGTIDDGLYVKFTSPAINTGTNTDTPIVDILGRSRVGIHDIGAYEFIPKADCLTLRHIGDNPIESGIHNAIVKITATGNVGASTNVSLNSAHTIELLPGFRTQSTAIFLAKIQNNCPMP